MINSRLIQLKKAQDELDHKLKWRPEDIHGPAGVLIDLVIEICLTSPRPPSSRQYLVEIFQAQASAKYLLDTLSRYLFSQNKLKEIYECVQDPLLLSSCIGQAFNYPAEEICVNMAREALVLGGILSSKYSDNSSGLNDPQGYRIEKILPPVDIVKSTLLNRFKHEWAIEHTAEASRRYGEFTGFMLGYMADVEPEWTVHFILQHENRLAQMFDPYPFDAPNPASDAFYGVIRATLTANLFIELNKQRPEYFDALMSTRFMPDHLLHAVTIFAEFKMADFPLHERINDLVLSQFFLNCVLKGTLTDDRLNDLRKSWGQYGLPGDIAAEVIKSKSAKNMLAFVKPYYQFIKDPTVTAQDLLNAKNDYRDIRVHFDVLDGLLKKPGQRLADSPVAMENHTAFLLAARSVDTEFCNKAVVTAKTLEVCVRKLDSQTEGRDGALIDFVRKAIKSKKHHPEVSKLSHQLVRTIQRVIPKLDVEFLRVINWKDGLIKAELLEDAMGL